MRSFYIAYIRLDAQTAVVFSSRDVGLLSTSCEHYGCGAY